MKYWLSHLPCEVWVDVYRYPWISRAELAIIVHRFGNRKYAKYLQFYLHDWGKRKLKNELWFDQDGLFKYVNYAQHRLNFPQTPMPSNIKSFERISIYHFDAQTIAFLHQIAPILTGVNVGLFGYYSPNDMENFCIIFANLLPLLNNGIHSLLFNVHGLPTMEQSFGDKLAKLERLEIFHNEDEPMDEATLQTTVNFLTNWLTSSKQDGNWGPKLCKAHIENDTAFVLQVSSAIREQFIHTKTPCTFVLILDLIDCGWDFAEFHLTNGIGEELHGQRIGNGDVQITRHRANCSNLLEEWIDESNAKSHHRRIGICQPTIGLLDAIVDAPENLEEANQQQASTSKAV